MKTKKWRLFTCLLSLVVPTLVCGQNLDHLQLLAHYPFNSNANDTTGNYGPADLINVPFQDGGIYCNGIYLDGVDPNGSMMLTPAISGLTFDALAVSCEFKIGEYPSVRRPIVVCDPFAWRWLWVFIASDSTIGFGAEGDFYKSTSTKIKPELNKWHSVTAVWDSSQSKMKLYFNGSVIDSATVSALDHGQSRRAGNTHGGVGLTYKGWLRNLKIYTKKTGSTAVAEKVEVPQEFALAQNFPNPFNPETRINFSLPTAGNVHLTIFDASGREIRKLLRQPKGAGSYSVLWDGRDNSGASVASGLYFYELRSGHFTATRSMTLLR